MAQVEEQLKNYKDEPHWIRMMHDPNVNYFEAIKAFEQYWEKREVPTEEEEWKRSGMKQARGSARKQSDFKRSIDDQSEKYIVEYRQFKTWLESVQAYIKEDGTLLSIDERLELWKKLRAQQTPKGQIE